MRRYWPILILLAIAVFIVAELLFIRRPNGPQTTEEPQLKLAVTIFPLADILKNVGGDYVEVVTLLPPGASPHTFDPSPATVANASGAKAVYRIGYGLDNWAQTIATASNLPVYDLSANVPIRTLDNQPDPHYWLSPANASQMAANAAHALSALDPAHAADFQRNATAYQKELATVDEELRIKLTAVPNKNIATFHEAWFYFADRYGLKVAAAFEPSPGKEPTPKQLAEMSKAIRENHLKIIYTEPQLSTAALEQTAKDLGVKLDVLDPIGGDSTSTDSYLKLMRYNGDKLYQALK